MRFSFVSNTASALAVGLMLFSCAGSPPPPEQEEAVIQTKRFPKRFPKRRMLFRILRYPGPGRILRFRITR